jgi:hydroxymethylglutaryl-CoA lyase
VSAAKRVGVVEVGPRDGLQNEPVHFSTAQKIAFIGRVLDAGVRRIEVASFVNPKRVPQMADAEAVLDALPAREGVRYIGLVLNARGAERALHTKVHELGAVCAATDSFAQANQGQTAAESLATAMEIVRAAWAGGRLGQITISASFGCPFEGEVRPERVLDIAKRAAEARPIEIALADTIGAAVPAEVSDLFGRAREAIAPIPLRAHFHNTRNTAIANVWAAIEVGATTVDASLGGLGGCPFAPKATGNVASEDVVYLLDRSHVETGIDLAKLIAASHWLAGEIGRTLPGMVARAGSFPMAKTDVPA